MKLRSALKAGFLTWRLMAVALGPMLATALAGADWAFPKQKELLDPFLRVLPKSEPWEKWLRATGELPPNFDVLPSIPFLPDPLRFANGREVKQNDWPARRVEILKQFERYVTGAVPPAPGNVRAARVRPREEPGAVIHQVELEFGPNHQAHLRIELLVPKAPGPFPVLLVPETHRPWAVVAVSRGYLACVYAASEVRDDSDAWAGLWPAQDWSRLTRRAWAASRCVDYLLTLPAVEKGKVGLAGHAENGKTALIAAALDARITAVIASSSGGGGACSYRLFSEVQCGEGIELITRVHPDWFHPRLRFFAGREQKLPVDQSELVACVAPRPCLISSALHDPTEGIWAIEQTYHSARRVYDLLGAGGQLNLRYRSGGHETGPGDIESYLDWLDDAFGRAPFAMPDCVLFPTYAMWQQGSGERIDAKTFPTNSLRDLLTGPKGAPLVSAEEWMQKKADLRGRILWGLGEAPPFAESGSAATAGEPAHAAALLGRGLVPTGLQRQSLLFGNAIPGDLYLPTGVDRGPSGLPAVIWLHPVSTAHGYVPGVRRGDPPHLGLARLGCAVLAYDQIGHGSRLEEVRNFYLRYPRWSLLGKMVEDALAAVESLHRVPLVDPRRVYLVGYGLGGMVALHAAALDERVAGVVSVAGFTPMRLDRLDKGTGGLARWAGWLPLQPRLGAFVGEESRVPYDYHEVLAMIAPRPAVVLAPVIDSQATLADVKWCVAEAGRVFDLLWAASNLQFQVLEDYNHFSPEIQQQVADRLKKLLGP